MNKGKIAKQIDNKWRDYVLLKAEYRCEICGKEAGVVHHLVFKSESKKLRFNEKNLIPLCSSCHSKFHLFGGKLKRRMELALINKRGLKWANYLEITRKRPTEQSFWTVAYLKKQERKIDKLSTVDRR